MFSENEVFFLITFVLAIYIGLTILWRRLLDFFEGISFGIITSTFTIKNSDRIFTFYEDLIIQGIWCQVMISLWKDRKSKNFYLSKTYEYNKDRPLQEFSYIDKWKAEEIISKYAPLATANLLIADWIKGNNRALPT